MPEETIAGRYRLLEPLGRGAMSSVWLAEDEELGRRVAVKMLAPNADRARFEREARAVASLSHPNIAGLYDYGEAEGRPYMVLEYLPGGTLEERLRSGPLPDTETRRIAEAVAAGLAHAHDRGLVHRDLKPANVLFDVEDRPKIADFGIARISGGGTLTEAGTVLGTASYISPEQAAGEPAGPPSDVYSFGAILFRMLTGRLPFVGTNAMELVRQHRDDPAPPVRSVRPDAPADLAEVADATLAKRPAARPADGAALLAALTGGAAAATAILGPGTAAAAAAAGATQLLRPTPPPARRRRIAPLALAVVLLALLAGGAAAAWLATRSSDAPPPTTPPASVSLPTVTAGRTSTAGAATTPATTAPAATTAAPTTTASTTTTAPTTTRAAPTTTRVAPTTTAPHVTTIAPPTVSTPPPITTSPVFPTTTAAAPTTAPTTTAATTTTAAAPPAPATTTGP